jgi:hypothetical protein
MVMYVGRRFVSQNVVDTFEGAAIMLKNGGINSSLVLVADKVAVPGTISAITVLVISVSETTVSVMLDTKWLCFAPQSVIVTDALVNLSIPGKFLGKEVRVRLVPG